MTVAAGLLLALGAAACARDALVSPQGPRLDEGTPAPLTITPDTVMVGDTGVVLTLRGSGFTEQTSITFSASLYTTRTFVDDSTFSVRIHTALGQAAIYQVSVLGPNGETYAPGQLTVLNPVPVLERIAPDVCESATACGPLTLHGRNFKPGVAVQWNGQLAVAQRLNDSTITVQPGSVQAPGLVGVAVRNSPPGGGMSATLLLQVGTRVMMHTSGARAGGSGFPLEIHGDGFTTGSTVHWNGSPRQTTYINPRRLNAMITAADVAVPGQGVVTVSSPQVAGGTPFTVGTVAVRPLPSASVTSQLTLGLPVRDLAYSARTQRLYGTVYTGPNTGNVAVIDPQTGTVESYIPVGPSPRYLALSDDGQYLWVAVDNEGVVRRVDLDTGQPDAYVWLELSNLAQDLAAVPGQPLSVAVSHRGGCCQHLGVAVYDGYWGTMRPTTTSPSGSSNVIEFGALGSTLYGLDNSSSLGRYRTLRVDDGGVTVMATGTRAAFGPYADFVFSRGRLYTSHGYVVDPDRDGLSGQFGMSSNDGPVVPDPQTGRAFFLNSTGIRVGDVNTFAVVGTLPVPPLAFENPNNQRRRIVRWGTDGLAFFDADQVFILRSPIVAP